MAARDAGVNEFCVKPVTPADLMKRIAWVIDKPCPFVRSPDYFGPDRRRKDDPNYKGPSAVGTDDRRPEPASKRAT